MDRRAFVKASVLTSIAAAAPALGQGSRPQPPSARMGDHVTAMHGLQVPDPLRWLRDPGFPPVADREILAYLEAENAWFQKHMGPEQPRIEALFAELRGRVKEDDESVPVADGPREYWWAFEPGAQYRQWFHRPRGGGPAQLALSEVAQAQGRDYFRLGVFSPSPDGRWLAWSSDASGDERFRLVLRDLATGEDRVVVAEDAVGAVAWTADSGALAWAQASAEWRPDRARLHRLGSAPGDDPVLYREEQDYWVSVGATQDRRFLTVTATQSATTEVRLVDPARPAEPMLVRPRTRDLSYSVDSRGDGQLYILANDNHENFRVATAPLERPGAWTDFIAGSDRDYLRGLTAFSSYLALEERVDGLDQVRLVFPDGRQHRIAFPEASYTAGLGSNPEADAPVLRLSYASMVSPNTVHDYVVAEDRLVTRKVQQIPSGYDASRYATERLMIPVRDGVRVPVSVLYRRDYAKGAGAPLHVYGYGSYGMAMPPGFSANRLSLVDRGFAFALAHIRGGDDMGYGWYLDGKRENKANTFNDFMDVTRGLHQAGFGGPGRTSASGGSAGGWLMGVVATEAPELWGAIVAHVPFVDVLNTMLDTSLPLTPGEFPEWGNPIEDPETFRRLLALSPYDQVRDQRYPPILVTAGLNDPRVTYWEPAKWVARMRATRTDDNLLLLKTNMGAGHGGRSGRFEALRETAEEFAFILNAMGLRAG